MGRKRKSRTQKRASLLFYPFLAKTSYAPMFILHILVMLMYFFRLTLVIWISREIFVSRFWEFTRQWYIKNFWSQEIKIWKNLRKICFSNFFKPTSNLKKTRLIRVSVPSQLGSETLAETSGPLCITDLFQNKSVAYFLLMIILSYNLFYIFLITILWNFLVRTLKYF